MSKRNFLLLMLLSLFFFANLGFGTDLYPGSTSIFLPYANARTNHELTKSPKIYVGFNGSGRYHEFVMDTGSVGIIASADYFKPAPGAKNLGPGQQYYSSSGVIEKGTWWSATQEFYDEAGQLLAIANVPVLQVTSVECTKRARYCHHPKKHPKGIAMMGVGFARKSSPHGTPDYNPFLNIQKIRHQGILKFLPHDWTNGYIVTRHGVEIGLTAHNTAHAALVKLMPWIKDSPAKLPEWMPAPMTLVVNGASGDGHVLVDTGVDDGYLTPPANTYLGPLAGCMRGYRQECAPPGTVISVYFPNQMNAVASYTFTVGQGNNPMRPRGIHIVKAKTPFFNTSRHILSGMDFLYDNTHGYVGYIQRR